MAALHYTIALAVLTALLSSAPAHATEAGAPVRFTPLGDLAGGPFESKAGSITRDGRVIVGSSAYASRAGVDEEPPTVPLLRAFRWTEDGGMVALPGLGGDPASSEATAVTDDGRMIYGSSSSPVAEEGPHLVRWVDSVLDDLGSLCDFWADEPSEAAPCTDGDPATGIDFARIEEVASDGSVAAGTSLARQLPGQGRPIRGFTWSETGGFEVFFPAYTGPGVLSALFAPAAMSADGQTFAGLAVIIGQFTPIVFLTPAFIGDTQSASPLPAPPTADVGEAYELTSDGSVAVGRIEEGSFNRAVLWRDDEFRFLGPPSARFAGRAYAVSTDASVVAGTSGEDSIDTQFGEAFVWTEATGARRLKTLLEVDHGLDLTGWDLHRVIDMSADGRALVGTATNPDGNQEAFLVTLPPTASEGFDDLPLQRDDVGTSVGDDTVFAVRDDSEGVVATASGALLAAVGIALESDDPYWFIESKPGLLTSTSVPLALGLLPGNGATSGPFAGFGAPQDLRGTRINARLRARPLPAAEAAAAGGSGEPCGAEARLVVLDAEDNAFATEPFPLGEQFERFSVAIESFTEALDGAAGIDLEAIEHIGLELLATCTEPPPTEYGADDIAIAVPEPRSLGAAALAGLAFVCWSRRHKRGRSFR